MFTISNLDVHVTHECNLKCKQCCHWSNRSKGHVALADFENWLQGWHQRLTPQDFNLIGGEPTLHPDLPQFIELTRKYYPTVNLFLWTNGIGKPNWLEIIKKCQEHHCGLVISQHAQSQKFDLIEGLSKMAGVSCRVTDSWSQWQDIEFRPYEEGNPRQSWEYCTCRRCPQLLNGDIYKCPQMAYLNVVEPLPEVWKPYLNYAPLKPTASDEEVIKFFQREEEWCCNACPSTTRLLRILG